MGYWHELPVDPHGWIFPPRPGGRVGVAFMGADVRKAPFRGCFMRYEGAGDLPKGILPAWKRNPEGWFELWPHSPLFANSMEEAKSLFQPLLPQVEDGSLDAACDRRPYQPPVKPTLVLEIAHTTHLATAKIAQSQDTFFEVKYIVYAPSGRYFPASTPGISSDLNYDWGVIYKLDESGARLRTLADSIESAELIARIELDQFVIQDPEIKMR